MKEIGLQLYTIRDFMRTEEDVRESFQKMRKYGYTQAQTFRNNIPFEVLGRIAKEEGIEIVGTHDDFQMMVNNFDQALKNHMLLDTKNMGVGGFHDMSLEGVKRFIEQANQVAAKASEHGMKFTYHNHSHEFIKLENGKTIMEMLIEELDPKNTSFVLDTYWVQYAGGDVRDWIEKLAGRIDILHLKDMRVGINKDGSKSPMMAEIGAGNMNWELILNTAQKTGVQYYVVEQDRDYAINCYDSIRKSAEYLRGFMS